MLFNSGEYLLFFGLVLLLCWRLVGFPKLRIWALLLASYYFYTSNNSWLIILILVSTQIDYLAGLFISRTESVPKRRFWLTASLVTNLGILGVFKYFNFFAGAAVGAMGALGVELDWVDVNILLPVGISFYTFQSMAYTIDVYKGYIKAETSWRHFAFYISFFPQLIAGPIVRAEDFLPQAHEKPQLTVEGLNSAVYRLFLGLFKKIVLADFLATYADLAYNNPGGADSLTAWVGMYAFSFQIYFDFSGYTDIAIGSARLLGFQLPENFNRPYMASSFSAFWRRWHITLSSWFRDYLYIPLGGSRTKTALGKHRNLLATMALCGLWHGAAWNFVIWGVMHGLLLCFERATSLARYDERTGVLRGFVMFNLISLTWIPFRAGSLGEMSEMLSSLFLQASLPQSLQMGVVMAAFIFAGAWLAQCLGEYKDWSKPLLALPTPLKGAVCALVWILVMICNSQGAKQFIYFQF